MPKKINKPFWSMTQTSQTEANINIDGEISTYKWDESDTTGASFRDDLKALGDVDVINLHINSPGGSVFEGISIFNQLKQNKATINVYVDGLAASIASVIAMAGDTIFVPENAMLMIHNPWTVGVGNASELRKQADDLDRIAESSVTTYLAKSNGKITEEKLRQLLDEETWLSASEAVEYGLADEVLPANQMAASISDEFKQRYQNVPSALLKQAEPATPDTSDMRQKMINRATKTNQLIKQTLGGF
ncbi:Clp protease ClpP [Latilactobacillus curvatus]|uniref:head maturation protease, ClpP-related n=1 Tax=Latilactobacillus curvatus TaxID=28038 RepID=UPI0020C81EA5|nr:head maturation protease, ClpP-related [Latilactobacillus curvatus]MCP8858926.1 Clp protease ClpP [Latilactobacillus curvatus]